ncbi:uncharacterized protein LOC107825631 isoform X2 [Nicotiana tabacum]|uniref:Uncharacterized protein isoform X2 n=2 Tax=Nicotiana tabacum TaxID=4097 RepID=A0A1S4D3T2_TOBAC|nr:PREDICTED: uncharacterized protein LOC107825631 isoform X2 [Nicotiana tabacum]
MKFRHRQPTHLSPSSAPYRSLRVGVNCPSSFFEKSKLSPPHARADYDYGLPHQAPHILIITKVLGCFLIEVIKRMITIDWALELSWEDVFKILNWNFLLFAMPIMKIPQKRHILPERDHSFVLTQTEKNCSQANRINRAKQKMPHMGGSKSIATFMNEKVWRAQKSHPC